MAVPTQVLPSWLTLSTTVVTLPDGVVSTSSTTLQLPLTYFGPSIPLGTDGVWTWGGLTPPPSTISASTTTTATPTSSSPSSAITSAPSTSTTLSPTSASSTPSSSILSATSSTASSTSTIPTASPAAGSSHGISPSTLGAILGSILGTLLLLVLIAIIFLLRQTRKRRQVDPQDPSSSFWNRSTTLMSMRRSQQPIWTGWDIVEPRDLEPSPPRSPGEGSPRESGDEEDPFLTRGSIRSGTEAGHTRTDTDTLVSLPAIARTGTVSSYRSKARPGEPIIPRDVQLRMGEEMADAPPYPSIRMVERRPSTDVESPLLPPRPIDPDSLGVAARRASNPSLGSEKRSIMSDKSLGSLDLQEAEGAEMLTARRVKVAQIQPGTVGASTSAAAPNVLGLDRLANLGRLSWFRRMSFLGTPAGSQLGTHSEQEGEPSDTYTRTPPRHSRHGSRSRPGSQSRPASFRISTHEPTSPTTDSFGRRIRQQDAGLGFGMGGERPISSVSAVSEASGNTVFFDARSRPGSSLGTRTTQGSGPASVPPVPPMPAAYPAQPSPLQREVRRSGSGSPGDSHGHFAGDSPPTYEAATRPQSVAVEYSDIDVLDMPAPRPASPFSAASGSRSSPPGLPDISVWRNSIVSSTAGPATIATDSTSRVDVLDDAPPSADNGWSSLSGGGRHEGRRLTFGVCYRFVLTQPRDALQSERGSLHSMRSHLSPHSSHSPSGSAAASSRHTLTGSNSSRPSGSSNSHSRRPTGSSGQSLAHTNSISFDDHRPGRRHGDVGEVAPPLSAVFSRGFPGTISPPPPRSNGHPDDVVTPDPAYPPGVPLPISVPTPSATVSGTVTSRTTTEDSLTDLSVTTTQTDPITGAVVHLPRLPWRSGAEAPWGERPVREDTMW
ncbi:hypothetical protein DICSQDRAFT_130061 [Dichomitus squalens LYAD-421 SS1]|uniref:Uncharacterized protein n=1 Tax=Dichomitus squalens (strain LYAD-421) TaxID=732165 RepID=R7SLB2_DICSQ|nr:uncharacterized protein DICSQDRAFT_130061 [Dichomitus squalens LYAD-421 SS1]EJF56520.1 hypothetical protein DICSQDRAFT_130061 [Dichomitus squalens LYAD-421 SS1]